MRAISLFSGAGGMDVGFRDAGFQIVVANELDRFACETFRANHPDTHLYEGDIADLNNDFFCHSDVDVVFGGPPCQGFSVAGKMDLNDPRSKLIFDFCSVVEKQRPKGFVMENVKALGVLSKFSHVRQALFSRFQKAGYSVKLHILNAKDFGVPQSRERAFFVGVQNGFAPVLDTNFRKHEKLAPTLREVLTPLGRPGSGGNPHVCNAKITLATKPVLRKSPYAGMLFNGQGRPLNPDGWANTLPASMGGNRTPIIDELHLYEGKASWVEEYHRHLIQGGRSQGMHDAPAYLRRLTIDEVAVLQSFPRDYLFKGSSSKVYSQIGNAVPCRLAYVVAMELKRSLSGCNSVNSPLKETGKNFEFSFA